MVEMVGGDRPLRVCDLCGGVDDHPRHVIAGQDKVFSRPPDHIIRRVLDNAPHDDQARLLGDLMDATSSDRHIDCCAAAGCPTGTCDIQAADAPGIGTAMVEHVLTDDVVQAVRRHLGQPIPDTAGPRIRAALATQVSLGLLPTVGLLLAVGMSGANLVAKWLDMLSGTAFTAPAGSFIKLHTSAGDPGAAGTSNPSANTTRVAATWNAANTGTGAKTISNTPTWASWASGSETISYISEWDVIGPSGGNFLFSAALTVAKAITNGDTFTLSSLSFTLGALAA